MRMGHRGRTKVWAALVAGGFLVSGGAAAEKARGSNEVLFKVATNGAKGRVVCAVFTESGWLEKPVQADRSKINGRSATCRFANLKPGVYGISAFHDENSNDKLDTNLIGIPTEDWCTSRNAKGVFGPPSFSDAKFDYRGGLTTLKAQM